MKSPVDCVHRMAVFLALLAVSSPGSATGEEAAVAKEARGLFSPRVDYDEWTPLGRGDPLKNDPTYDYVPPVLEKVHYWVDLSSSRTQPPPATLERRTPASPPPASRENAFDPFLKFIDGPKFGRPSHQQRYQPPPPPAYFYKPQYETSVSPPEPQVIQYLHTVLVPPPAPPTPSDAAAAVEVQKVELALHSSGPWHEGLTQLATSAQPSSRITVTVTAAPVTATPVTAAPTSTSAAPATAAPTSAASTLTTDPLFSHYNQPVEPLRGPMYLIIQGHSKVKTYGSVKKHASYHGIPIQEDNYLGAGAVGKTTATSISSLASLLGGE